MRIYSDLIVFHVRFVYIFIRSNRNSNFHFTFQRLQCVKNSIVIAKKKNQIIKNDVTFDGRKAEKNFRLRFCENLVRFLARYDRNEIYMHI